VRLFRGLAASTTELARLRSLWLAFNPGGTVESYRKDGLTFVAYFDPQGCSKKGAAFIMRHYR